MIAHNFSLLLIKKWGESVCYIIVNLIMSNQFNNHFMKHTKKFNKRKAARRLKAHTGPRQTNRSCNQPEAATGLNQRFRSQRKLISFPPASPHPARPSLRQLPVSPDFRPEPATARTTRMAPGTPLTTEMIAPVR